jgi:hypothetical protein
MALYFPPTPTEGQRYVGINGITYTWLGNRWNGTLALTQGIAEYYVDNGDSFFNYDTDLHDLIDGATA